MKILYISPENTVGTLSLWKKEHISNNHICRTVTFFRSPKGFKDDICLELPFIFTRPQLAMIRHNIYKFYRGREGYYKEKDGYPPVWSPNGLLDKTFLKYKDWLWRSKTKEAIKKYDLINYDVVHFESGMDFLKDEFFAQALKKGGKKIICHYHGEDLRTRGVMPIINQLSDLNLTNEVDLLSKHPNIQYLFLPFEFGNIYPKTELNDTIRIAHAPTNRYYKGSAGIIQTCRILHNEGLITFDLIENVSHSVAMERKKSADIFIDQVGDKGGWGYGMNSVESLSMGICTLTEINNTYKSFIPDNPFINITSGSLEYKLRSLIQNREQIMKSGNRGYKWVRKKHDISSVARKLYSYYRSIGLNP